MKTLRDCFFFSYIFFIYSFIVIIIVTIIVKIHGKREREKEYIAADYKITKYSLCF